MYYKERRKRHGFALGKIMYEKDGEGNFLVKMKSAAAEVDTISGSEYAPGNVNTSTVMEECVHGRWNQVVRKTQISYHDHSIIHYFPSLLSDGKLPKSTKDKIAERNVKWGMLT